MTDPAKVPHLQRDESRSVLTDEVATPQGILGRVHLNNPRALNALTLDGVRIMMAALRNWRQRADVSAVLVTGEGTRAFCAGGDVKSLQQLGPITELDKPGQPHSDFFREEYELNALIASYPKPYASLLDGVVMGGGVGISIMGSHRIGTETMKFGMPETAIGFFPDVGGGYFLSRLGGLGLYLALTSLPISAALAAEVGITTHHIEAAQREEFLSSAVEVGFDAAVARYDILPVTNHLPLSQSDKSTLTLASRFFDGQFEGVEQLLEQLDDEAGPLAEVAQATAKAIRLRSPLALKITASQLARCRTLDFNACLELEYGLSQRMMAESDFFEGVRAVLVDKDHAPKWTPSTLADTSAERVESYFSHLEGARLNFD